MKYPIDYRFAVCLGVFPKLEILILSQFFNMNISGDEWSMADLVSRLNDLFSSDAANLSTI